MDLLASIFIGICVLVLIGGLAAWGFIERKKATRAHNSARMAEAAQRATARDRDTMISEKLRLRTFKIPEQIAVLLANRADALGVSKAALARELIDDLLNNPPSTTAELSNENYKLVLRGYYLSPKQDDGLGALAEMLTRDLEEYVSKGRLVRTGLANGLGLRPALSPNRSKIPSPSPVGVPPPRTSAAPPTAVPKRATKPPFGPIIDEEKEE